jgi:flagellar biosynthesis protein
MREGMKEGKAVKEGREIKVAVALAYNESEIAPKVVAKGKGWMAEKIIEKAKETGVVLQENPLVVNALSSLEVGEEIPPELYGVVAEILAFVYNMDRQVS